MKCQSCKSSRVAQITAKCSDLCGISIGNIDYEGYVPTDMGIGGGDYLAINCCLDCGQLQGKFPVPSSEIEKIASLEEVVDFYKDFFGEGEEIDLSYAEKCSAVKIAGEMSVFFQGFIERFIDFNEGQLSPTVEVFLKMYEDNRPYLTEY